jgi:hypothetical protein
MRVVSVVIAVFRLTSVTHFATPDGRAGAVQVLLHAGADLKLVDCHVNGPL